MKILIVLLIFITMSVNSFSSEYDLTQRQIEKDCLGRTFDSKTEEKDYFERGICSFFNLDSRSLLSKNGQQMVNDLQNAQEQRIAPKLRNFLIFVEAIVHGEIAQLYLPKIEKDELSLANFCLERNASKSAINSVNLNWLDLNIESSVDEMSLLLTRYGALYEDPTGSLNSYYDKKCGVFTKIDDDEFEKIIKKETENVVKEPLGPLANVDAMLTRKVDKAKTIKSSSGKKIEEITKISKERGMLYKGFKKGIDEVMPTIEDLIKSYKESVLEAKNILKEIRHFSDGFYYDSNGNDVREEVARAKGNLSGELERINIDDALKDIDPIEKSLTCLKDGPSSRAKKRRQLCKIFFCQIYNPFSRSQSERFKLVCRIPKLKGNPFCPDMQGNHRQDFIDEFRKKCLKEDSSLEPFLTKFDGNKDVLQAQCLEDF